MVIAPFYILHDFLTFSALNDTCKLILLSHDNIFYLILLSGQGINSISSATFINNYMCVKLQKKCAVGNSKRVLFSGLIFFPWKYRGASLIKTHSSKEDAIQTKQSMATLLKEIKS